MTLCTCIHHALFFIRQSSNPDLADAQTDDLSVPSRKQKVVSAITHRTRQSPAHTYLATYTLQGYVPPGSDKFSPLPLMHAPMTAPQAERPLNGAYYSADRLGTTNTDEPNEATPPYAPILSLVWHISTPSTLRRSNDARASGGGGGRRSVSADALVAHGRAVCDSVSAVVVACAALITQVSSSNNGQPLNRLVTGANLKLLAVYSLCKVT